MKKVELDIRHLEELYLSLKSTIKVAKQVGVSQGTVYKRLKVAGVLLPFNHHVRKYTCNDSFFSENSEKSLYWAGFLAADGWIRMHQGKYKFVGLELADKDIEHLRLFKDDIDFSGPVGVYKYNGRGKCRVSICSNTVFDHLVKFGFVPSNKTHTYCMPNWLINHKYVHHFIRGYFDGDGTTYNNYLRPTPRTAVGFRGTYKFLSQVLDIFRQHNIFDYDKKILFDNGIYKITFDGNIVSAKIRNFIYYDSNIYMDRKRDILFQNHVSLVNKSIKPVMATNIKTGDILKFNSISSVQHSGIFTSDAAGRACNGKFGKSGNLYKGYLWEHINDFSS